MPDREYAIEWEKTKIKLHAHSAEEAQKLALEFIRTQNVLKVTPIYPAMCQEHQE